MTNTLRGAKLRVLFVCAGTVALASLAGCETPNANLAAGAGIATAFASQAPSAEIQQTYYFGVFDPQDQVPATVYRLRVHGQSSFISPASFASGWVPADFIDSLGTTVGFERNTSGPGALTGLKFGGDTTQLSDKNQLVGRRLILFGPEGFREAPSGQRLVIAMGSNPDGFFNGISDALGLIAQAKAEQSGTLGSNKLSQELFTALRALDAEQKQLDDLAKQTAASGAGQ